MKRTIAVRKRGKHFRFHTTNIHKVFFWHLILLLCYFLFLVLDWNKTLIGWKSCLTFSFSVNFWGLGVEGGGLLSSPSVCLMRKSILASDKSLVYGSAWALSGARRLGTSDWVDCFSWVCSQPHPHPTPLPPTPHFIAGLHCGKTSEKLNYTFVFVLFSYAFTFRSGFRSFYRSMSTCHSDLTCFLGGFLWWEWEWCTTRACHSQPVQSFAQGCGFKWELLLGR